MGKTVMKVLLIGNCIGLAAFGGAQLVVGILFAMGLGEFDSLQGIGLNVTMWVATVYTMIGLGAALFLVALLGCCGAQRGGEWRKNTMLQWHMALVSIIVLAEFVLIWLTASFWGSINEPRLYDMIEDVQQNYDGPNAEDGLSVSWNKMQFKWQCCGAQNFTDYRGSKYATFARPVPYTCCVYKAGSPSYDQKSSVENYAECMSEARHYNYPKGRTFKHLNAVGCYRQLESFFLQHTGFYRVLVVAGGVVALSIIGDILSCFML